MNSKTKTDLSQLEWEIEPNKFSGLKRICAQDFHFYDCYTVIGALWLHIKVIIRSHDYILAVGKDRSWVLNSVEDLNDFVNNKTYLE